jgi:hypothetical protein
LLPLLLLPLLPSSAGISFALGSIGSSLVMSFCIAAIAELPSYLIAAWAIERWGRWVGQWHRKTDA